MNNIKDLKKVKSSTIFDQHSNSLSHDFAPYFATRKSRQKTKKVLKSTEIKSFNDRMKSYEDKRNEHITKMRSATEIEKNIQMNDRKISADDFEGFLKR